MLMMHRTVLRTVQSQEFFPFIIIVFGVTQAHITLYRVKKTDFVQVASFGYYGIDIQFRSWVTKKVFCMDTFGHLPFPWKPKFKT